jgi:hypothetical protein
MGDLAHQPMPMVIGIGDPGASDGLLSVGGEHSIVLFGFTPDGRAEIGDPFSGRQTWTFKQLSQLYRGQGIALIHKAT